MNIQKEWEEHFKPEILSHKKVPKEIVAELLDVSTQTVMICYVQVLIISE